MITKLLVFLLVFAALNIVREGLMFYKAMTTGQSNMTPWRLLGIGVSISYIMTIILTGFSF